MASISDDDEGNGRLYNIPIYLDSDDDGFDAGSNLQPTQHQRSEGTWRGGDSTRYAGRRGQTGNRRRGRRERGRRGGNDNRSSSRSREIGEPDSDADQGRFGYTRGRGHESNNYRGRGDRRGRGDDRDRGGGRGRGYGGRGRGDGRGRPNFRHGSSGNEEHASVGGTGMSPGYKGNQDGDADNHNVGMAKRETEPMQFHKLVHLSRQLDDSDKVLLDISNTRSGLKEFLDNPIEAKCYVLLFKILSTIVKSQQLHSVRRVMQLVEQHLLPKLPEFLNDVCMRTQDTRYVWAKQDELAKFVTMVTAVLNKCMTTLHSSLSKCSVVVMSLHHLQMTFFPGDASSPMAQAIEETISIKEAIIDGMEKLREESIAKSKRPTRKRVTDENRAPPDDFRCLSILPTLVDLQIDEKPFLRANKTQGKYDSLDTYLDIQYRLLREDYINPLRTGISQYRESIRTRSNVTRFRDIRLYHDVQILRPICSPSGINYVIQFDVSRFTRMNWSASKRLIHGSLLCLSNDDFDSILYAVVTDRQEKDLNDGMLQVHFEDLPEWLQPSDKFMMAETTAYFEAYRHILQGLQEIQSLPLQRYIVNCETVLRPPEYLLKMGGPMYDFSCLMKGRDNEEMFPVLNTSQWPSKSHLGFDASQYEALKIAITKEMAIIQGPPGTGKTYVGLKIAKLLIANKKIWKRDKNSHAILVVCYTNHALDQFLEGVLEFSAGGIVRIGGRCNSEVLEDFILKNLKKKKREEKSRSWGILQNEKDCRASLRESERFITDVSMKLKKCTTELISISKLSEFMTEEQIRAFRVKYKDERDREKCIYDWLGLTVHAKDDESLKGREEVQVRRLWETYIIEKAEKMAHTLSNIGSVWDLDLQSRAELYKLWISEFIGGVELKLHELKVDMDANKFKAAEEILEKLIMFTETEILNAKTLSSYIKSQSFQRQLQQLAFAQGNQVPFEKVMHQWLCLDESSTSTELIKATLNSIQDKENSSADLEEEREIRDDDLMFTFGDEEDTNYGGKQSAEDLDDWTVQWKKKKTKQEVTAMLKKSKSLSEDEVVSIQHIGVWNLSLSTKRNLYKYWLDKYRNKLRGIVKDYEKQFNDATLRLEEVRNQETMEILKSADFIGMTTTGAAKYRQLLQSIGPRIIIVEEAAEVLESHIVTTLNDQCNHLILIGDHKQLRPSTTVYELAKKYKLDISLFERLVNNGVPCVTLSEQHRMRPRISVLMRHKNLYPNLKDHPIVQKYDNVKGLDVNVQFITHGEIEGTNAESTSYHNIFEARFVSRFCSHLLKQGYVSDQITVLTPYMGQVLSLRKEMPKSEFQGVRITAVDNYQGEENDIILLSLVRSSNPSKVEKRNPIGFLGIENRVCVALSRAKMGLFVFGNFTLLKNHSEMWEYMVKHAEKVDSAIKLICQNHPRNILNASKPDDFNEMPEGGCKESCGYPLKCGHICEMFCHIVDKDHKFTKCFKPCPKKCEFGHKCKKKCYQECKKCDTIVEKTVPMCGHSASMQCHKDPYTWKCKTICPYILSCGHACKQDCDQCTSSSRHRTDCREKCNQKLSCGHTVEVECFRLGMDIECSVLCEDKLDCGHKCTGKCGVCLGGKIHSGCKGSCSKILPCGHKCAFPCSELCPPCSRKCENKCPHNIKCTKKCAEPCIQCNEYCMFKCSHLKCEKSCSETCDEVSCNIHCTRGIQNKDVHKDCDHKCIGLCGETCPKLCAVCDLDKLEDGDYSYSENDRFIELPDCGHVIEVTRMDRIMTQPIESRGEIVKRCPKCKKVIRRCIRRYATILKENRQAVLDRFKLLTGSEKERLLKAKSLKDEIFGLRNVGVGLEEDYIEVLITQVIEAKFGYLLVAGRKLEQFKILLRLRKDLANFVRFSNLQENLPYCIDGIRDAKSIQRVLLIEKQYVSKQYWREVRMEIQRIQTILDITKLREEKGNLTTKDPLILSYFKKSLTLLTDGRPFNDATAQVIDKVKARIANPDTAIKKATQQPTGNVLRSEHTLSSSKESNVHLLSPIKTSIQEEVAMHTSTELRKTPRQTLSTKASVSYSSEEQILTRYSDQTLGAVPKTTAIQSNVKIPEVNRMDLIPHEFNNRPEEGSSNKETKANVRADEVSERASFDRGLSVPKNLNMRSEAISEMRRSLHPVQKSSTLSDNAASKLSIADNEQGHNMYHEVGQAKITSEKLLSKEKTSRLLEKSFQQFALPSKLDKKESVDADKSSSIQRSSADEQLTSQKDQNTANVTVDKETIMKRSIPLRTTNVLHQGTTHQRSNVDEMMALQADEMTKVRAVHKHDVTDTRFSSVTKSLRLNVDDMMKIQVNALSKDEVDEQDINERPIDDVSGKQRPVPMPRRYVCNANKTSSLEKDPFTRGNKVSHKTGEISLVEGEVNLVKDRIKSTDKRARLADLQFNLADETTRSKSTLQKEASVSSIGSTKSAFAREVHDVIPVVRNKNEMPKPIYQNRPTSEISGRRQEIRVGTDIHGVSKEYIPPSEETRVFESSYSRQDYMGVITGRNKNTTPLQTIQRRPYAAWTDEKGDVIEHKQNSEASAPQALHQKDKQAIRSVPVPEDREAKASLNRETKDVDNVTNRFKTKMMEGLSFFKNVFDKDDSG